MINEERIHQQDMLASSKSSSNPHIMLSHALLTISPFLWWL